VIRGIAKITAMEGNMQNGSTVYLSAGSNLGRRAETLKRAVVALGRGGSVVNKISPLYRTEPVGFKAQPWFLNLALELQASLSPMDLLEHCQEIELSLGRSRSFPNAPRTLDLDILLYEDQVIDQPLLQIPHPKMTERRFVLEPLAQIAPHVVHPLLGKNIRSLLAACSDQAAVTPYSLGDAT
jgi:2-amino-4-hydroxy-6-hydroxymethyldihydropteridine diphosphokinase